MSWTLIEHQALTLSVASVTLGSGGTIPQTYKTLKLVISARTDASSFVDNVGVRPNNSTTNHSYRLLEGSGSAAASYNGTTTFASVINGGTATASTFGSAEVTIPNYAGSTNKPMSIDGVNETNATGAYQDLTAKLWADTAAITSLVLVPLTGPNFVSGSTFTLYGLA